MDITLNLDAEGFCPLNALACAQASVAAYTTVTLEDAAWDTQVTITETPDAFIVAFRGTSSVRDFVTDLNFRFARVPAHMGTSCVHHGFWHAANSVMPRVMERLNAAAYKRVFFCGHSLGGALATIAAFLYSGLRLHSVYTFGAPRVGNAEFRATYNETLKERTFHFVNESDVVPRTPGLLMGFRHVGNEIFLPWNGGYQQNPSLCMEIASAAWSLAVIRKQGWGFINFVKYHEMLRYLARAEELAS